MYVAFSLTHQNEFHTGHFYNHTISLGKALIRFTVTIHI